MVEENSKGPPAEPNVSSEYLVVKRRGKKDNSILTAAMCRSM